MSRFFLRKKNKLGTCGLRHCSSGQSLVEAMLAVAILTISIVGALSLLSQVSTIAFQARNQFMAANLAQEGIELVQNIRTTNWIQNQQMLTNLSAGTYCSDFTTSPPTLTSSGTACSLYLNSSNEYVLAMSSSLTPFSRLITLMDGTDHDGIAYLDVQSTVIWDGSHSIIAEDRLYDWK